MCLHFGWIRDLESTVDSEQGMVITLPGSQALCRWQVLSFRASGVNSVWGLGRTSGVKWFGYCPSAEILPLFFPS